MKRWLLALLLATAGCTDDEPAVFPFEGPREVTFPAQFLLGTTTAAFGVETGLAATDWGSWAALPGTIEGGDRPDDGPDALAHVREDVERMESAGLTAYRLGIELARVYPTREAFDANEPDAAGLAAYDELVNALVSAGITPMVTLHDHVWPAYFADGDVMSEPQGWERIDARTAFGVWCTHMAEHFGDRVDVWITIDDPVDEAVAGYVEGTHPPGLSDADRALDVLVDQLDGHVRCYDAIHLADDVDADRDGEPARVSLAAELRVYEAADPASAEDRLAAEHSRRFWNGWFFDAVVRGDVDQNFDGAADVTGDPDHAGRADFIGVDYDGVAQLDAGAEQHEGVGALPSLTGLDRGRPTTDTGRDIVPAGLGVVLDEAARWGLPIYVTANGLADAADDNRERFVAEHLWEVGSARARGLDVRGYLYASLLDGFMWTAGFCPRFGLFTVDYASADKTRSATRAVDLLHTVATEHRLERALIEALPPYAEPSTRCTDF